MQGCVLILSLRQSKAHAPLVLVRVRQTLDFVEARLFAKSNRRLLESDDPPHQTAWQAGLATHAPHERACSIPIVASLLFTRADSPFYVKA